MGSHAAGRHTARTSWTLTSLCGGDTRAGRTNFDPGLTRRPHKGWAERAAGREECALVDDNAPIPQQPSYGLDSLVGLVSSLVLSPLYLYATLRGKSRVWDDLLDALPDDVFRAGPALDHRRPNRQRPLATYLNAASLSCVPHTVLHTASFAERFPFADGAFSLVTSNLALHNASREGRLVAVREIARVCRPGGTVLIVDLFGFFKDHRAVLEEELKWTDVDVSMVGVKMLYGALPCQVLRATKPMAQST
ncbi:hypothetical protein ACCO45_008023 [Purpureocillium lilacinum]|uniref:Uncharacterized protein n=1 Tax=Purpureocillium lilacinum TaxID=33203 RepID=A0ACC4DM42_PURLI